MHRHAPEEIYRGEAGELAVYREDGGGEIERIALGPGDVVHIPGGRSHTVRNESAADARAYVVFSPGAEMERFMRAAAQLGAPSPADVIALAERHGIEFAGPAPRSVPTGRRRGPPRPRRARAASSRRSRAAARRRARGTGTSSRAGCRCSRPARRRPSSPRRRAGATSPRGRRGRTTPPRPCGAGRPPMSRPRRARSAPCCRRSRQQDAHGEPSGAIASGSPEASSCA